MVLFLVMFSANCNTILDGTLAIGNSIKFNYSVVSIIRGNSEERGHR
jgi:hypothetical protein